MDQYEEIERYLEDEMSEEEEQAFLERLEHDIDLQEALQEAQAAYAAVDILHADSIRKRLLEVDADYVKKKANKRRVLWSLLAVATPIVLFLSLAPFFSSPDSPEEQLSITDPDSASQVNSLSKEERLLAYQTDICTQEEKEIRTRASKQNQSDMMVSTVDDSVALDMCILLASGDSAQIRAAIHSLIPEMKKEEKRLRFSAFVGLLYLKLGEEEEAKTYFSQTYKEKGNHNVEVNKILQVLN